MACIFMPKSANVRVISRVSCVLGGCEFDIMSDGKTEERERGGFHRHIIGNNILNLYLTQPPIMTKCGRARAYPCAKGIKNAPARSCVRAIVK